MSVLDLKPLTKEVIHKMGYSNHDLWVVKINEDVYGPFEVESLKHYASENDTMFVAAFASRLDSTDWQPFFSLAIFSSSRKQTEEKITMTQEGPFWILSNGQKTGPLPLIDIEKKIEMGILGLNELISYDDGHSWNKIYQLEAFAAKTLNSEELPASPNDSSFQRVKEDLLEKINSQSEEGPSAHQSLANLVYLGKKQDGTRLLNLEEIDLKSVKETEVSRSLKWIIPVMSGTMCVFLVTAYLLFKRPDPTQLSQADEEEIVVKKKKSATNKGITNLRPAIPAPQPERRGPQRRPASVPSFDRSEVTREASVHDSPAQYPEAQIDTHEPDRYPSNEPDPMVDPIVEADRPHEPHVMEGQEPSLVNDGQARNPARNDPYYDEGQTLDGAMNEATSNALEEQPPQPVMEEASDF